MPKRIVRSSVALRYDASLPAPLVVAKGKGLMAKRIDAIASESGVPVIRDEAIAMALEPLDIGDFVPPDYWELVARVLAFIASR